MNFKKISRTLFYLMIALLPFRIGFEFYQISIFPLEIIIYILSYLTIINYLFAPKKQGRAYLSIFLLYYLLSIPSKLQLLSPKDFIQGTWHIIRNIFEPLPLIFPLILLNFNDKRKIKKAVFILIAFTSISAAIGIVQTLSGGKFLTGIGVYGNFRYLGIYPPLASDYDPLGKEHLGKESVLTHVPNTKIFRAHGGLTRHNYFGAFLILVTTVTLSLAVSRKFLFYIAFLLQFAALGMTFTRAAYVGFAVALIFLFILKASSKKFLSIAILSGIMIIIFLSFLPPDINKQVLGRFASIINPEDTIEMQERLRAFDICIREIEKKPFFGHGGGGLEGFSIDGYRLTSHNDVLETIYTRGIFVFLIIYSFYFLLLGDALILWKSGNDTFTKGFAVGYFSGFMGLLVTGIAQPILMINDTSGLVWLSMGLIAASKMANNSEINRQNFERQG